jgi:hypothetical protein
MKNNRVEKGWPGDLGVDAYHGLAGEIVNKIDPQTEADPSNVMLTTLIGFGNMVGRRPHIRVGRTSHHANEFGLLVGNTAFSRKGTAMNDTRDALYHADPHWVTKCIKGGLSTGEGLIAHFDSKEGDPEVDRRLFIVEPEFTRILTVMNRPDNTLSHVYREAWETGDLSVRTRHNKLEVYGVHISSIAPLRNCAIVSPRSTE